MGPGGHGDCGGVVEVTLTILKHGYGYCSFLLFKHVGNVNLVLYMHLKRVRFVCIVNEYNLGSYFLPATYYHVYYIDLPK